MTKLMIRLMNMFRSDKGQGLVEYGMVIGLVAIAVVVAISALQGGISELLGRVTDGLAGILPEATQ